MKNENMTIAELKTLCTSIDIYIHGKETKENATAAIALLTDKEVEYRQADGEPPVHWATALDDNVKFYAFYEEQSCKTIKTI